MPPFGNNFSVSLYALGEDNPTQDGTVNPLYKAQNTLFSSLQPVTSSKSTMSQTSSTLAPGFFVFNNPNPDPGIPNSGYNSANGTVDNVAAMSLVAWVQQRWHHLQLRSSDNDGWSAILVTSPVWSQSNLGIPASVASQAGVAPSPAADMLGTAGLLAGTTCKASA